MVLGIKELAIRPFVLDEEEQKNAPAFATLAVKAPAAMKGMAFRMQVDVMDCLGCGNCADVCPGFKGNKALSMVPLEGQLGEAANWDFCVNNVKSKQNLVDVKSNVKNSQFATPLFEFSGACSVCEVDFSTLWRSSDGIECNRLFFYLFRFCTFYSLYYKREGPWSGMGKLFVRGLLRVRFRYGIS